ncbi:MAG: hypothetical protein KKG09_08320 [Verrucomicrobia bacterium]|nr:hypothetical protein [Verrucomicrobiota bacterium]MBU4248420.1 hypothetical protein [Verrucomicrobiota bacterium]MBU4290908.1 hypothetical protein [Verrucomicrobiota bacterium]MBU4497993.1 hypothetical protein [Verrucomicrobiota bacterium]MCG2679086.1 hypothetical protein [Kiritimatiellia bacterium]
MIQWHSELNPLIGALILLALAWAFHGWRRQLMLKMPPAKTLRLLAPRLLIAVLLVLALFDPAWRREAREPATGRILALVDTSSSMEVHDNGRDSRLARARHLLDRIRTSLPRGITLETAEFDASLRYPLPVTNPPPGAAEPRVTDLGACLLALSEQTDIASALGIILLTDGGDTPTLNVRLPPAPLSIIGLGTDPATWNDVTVAEVQAPATAEENVEFEINADLLARRGGDPQFASKLSGISAVLETESEGRWNKLAERQVDLSRQRARISFRTAYPTSGLRRYRIALAPVEGEVSALNNVRTFTVAVRKKSIHVLYFSRELGADFKLIRNELDRDPGISFTALFRTLSEHFTVQGDRNAADDNLQAGFPNSEKILNRFDCLMLGSFPADAWTSNQIQALIRYVEGGGAVIFLAGSDTFGPRAYANTLLAPLFPWQIAQSLPEVMTGAFPVSIPMAALSHPVMAGLDQRLKEEPHPSLDSVYQPGPLKAGAMVLLDAQHGQGVIPVIAVQAFGKGKILGLASNTFWKWARSSKALKEAQGIFWRQAIRYLTGQLEGGRLLEIHWDRDTYNPGEQAVAGIRATGRESGGALHLSATLATGGETLPLMVDSVPGQPDAYSVSMRFKHRGEAVFRLTASDGTHLLDTYEKTLNVAPLHEEGVQLEMNEAFLKALAEQGAGCYAREDAPESLLRYLQTQVIRKNRVTETSLCQSGPWFILLLLSLLVIEWTQRRRNNLI